MAKKLTPHTRNTPVKKTRNKDVAAGAPKSNNNDGSFAEQQKTAPTSPFDVISPDHLSALMDLAVRSAERWARARGITDRDSILEISSETTVQFLDAVKKRPHEVMKNPEGYLYRIAKNEAANVSATVSKSARSGFIVFNERVGEIEQTLGRSLTRVELDAEGNAIIENWHDPKRRPPKNFWKKGATRAVVGFSHVGDEDDRTYISNAFGNTDPSLIADQVVFEDVVSTGRWSASLLRIATEGKVNEGNIFRYNAFAEDRGAPMAILGSMTRRATDNARNAITKSIGPIKASKDKDITAYRNEIADGFVKVIHDWENGKETAATEALFKPFGEVTTHHQREDIVKVLMWSPQHSHELWKSALGAASESNKDRILRALGEK